jgi:hypothetical protein
MNVGILPIAGRLSDRQHLFPAEHIEGGNLNAAELARVDTAQFS